MVRYIAFLRAINVGSKKLTGWKSYFHLSRRRKNGWFGFPNNFVEKQLGVIATTRNWTIVGKILDFAEQGLRRPGRIANSRKP